MKAYVLHDINDLRYDEIEIPKCPENWAIVRVKAAGICSSDIPRIFYKGTYHFPTIPGHEFAGIVHSVGNSKDEYLIGKHVGVFPLIPCRKCTQCQKGHFEMCANYDYVGSRRDGGFAEYVAVPIWNLIPLASNINFTSAAMLEPLSVALHAMKMGNISEGQSVGIIGTGMIGISAAQWAKRLGADKITVIGRNKSKGSLVESLNLHYDLTSNTNISPFDVVLEAVGSPDSIELAIQKTTPGGTLILMGNPSGDINLPQDIYWKILRKQLIIKGTWNSSYAGKESSDWTEAAIALQNNEINVTPLISHCFTQEELIDGLNMMRDHKEVYCKVMTIWNQ